MLICYLYNSLLTRIPFQITETKLMEENRQICWLLKYITVGKPNHKKEGSFKNQNLRYGLPISSLSLFVSIISHTGHMGITAIKKNKILYHGLFMLESLLFLNPLYTKILKKNLGLIHSPKKTNYIYKYSSASGIM